MNLLLDDLKNNLSQHIRFAEKRPGITQLIGPFFHDDGDILDIFLRPSTVAENLKITDCGMTLMRLSYSYDLETDARRKIFQRILAESGAAELDGEIYVEANSKELYAGLMRFVQTVTKVSNMSLYRHEVVKSLFYEMVHEFMVTDLAGFSPRDTVYPLEDRPELEVDYEIEAKKPLYIFAVRDVAKARLTTIACLEFQRHKLPFRSVIIHEDMTGLPRNDQKRLTSAVDKQFPSFDDFRKSAPEYFEREMN